MVSIFTNMKKLFLTIALVMFLVSISTIVFAASFEDAYKNVNSKPMLLYVTAPWIDNADTYNATYKEAEEKLSGLYNVTKLDVTTPDLKIFNETFHIYPRLPYILLFKDGTKISRYLQRDCIKDFSCINERAKSFLN